MASKRTCVLSFGRFNPPTTGHALLIDHLVKVAQQVGGDVRVYPSQSQDAKKNPLPFAVKVKFLRRLFPKIYVSDATYVRTPIDAFADAATQGYTHLIVVVGADRVSDFRRFQQYLVPARSPKYDRLKHIPIDHYEVISAGERDPDADDLTGMSASKLRGFAVANDFEHFAQGVPSSNKQLVMDLFTQVRRYMGIHEAQSIFKLPSFRRLLESYKDQLRKEEDTEYQKYFKSMLKKHGYDSPADIPDEKKDDFFNAVDRGWTAEDEK